MGRWLVFVVLMVVGCATPAQTKALLLFGGDDHKQFLGCLNCSSTDPGSVCNPYGANGSEYRQESIWNAYGPYGSVYRTTSPWNEYATSPPVVVDSDGGFYGYLTDSYAQPKRTTDQALIDLIERARKDVSDASDWFCGRGQYE